MLPVRAEFFGRTVGVSVGEPCASSAPVWAAGSLCLLDGDGGIRDDGFRDV